MLTTSEIARMPEAMRNRILAQMKPGAGLQAPADLPLRRVASFDPSTSCVGWGILDRNAGKVVRVASGGFTPSKAKAAPDRYDQIAAFVSSLLLQYHPALIAIEVPSGGQRQSAIQLMTYARAVGTVEGTAYSVGQRIINGGIAIVRIPVATWKAGTGVRRKVLEGKSETMLRVAMTFGYQPASDDEADAIAIGLHALQK